jgi:hypothetical protein
LWVLSELFFSSFKIQGFVEENRESIWH